MITASITLIAQAAPLLIAACAALVSEYIGLLNVGIEGLMLLSAFTGIGGILLAESFGGLIPGIAVSLVLGAGLSIFITYLTVYRKANIYILGLAVNLTAAGFVSVLSTRLFGNRSIVALPPELLLQPQSVKTVSAALAVLTSLGLALFCRYTKTGFCIFRFDRGAYRTVKDSGNGNVRGGGSACRLPVVPAAGSLCSQPKRRQGMDCPCTCVCRRPFRYRDNLRRAAVRLS